MKFYDKYEYNPEDTDPEYGNVMIDGYSEYRKLANFDMKHDELMNKLQEGKYLGITSLYDEFNYIKEPIVSFSEIDNEKIQIKINNNYYSILRGYCSDYQHHGWYVYDDECDDYVAINSLEVYN